VPVAQRVPNFAARTRSGHPPPGARSIRTAYEPVRTACRAIISGNEGPVRCTGPPERRTDARVLRKGHRSAYAKGLVLPRYRRPATPRPETSARGRALVSFEMTHPKRGHRPQDSPHDDPDQAGGLEATTVRDGDAPIVRPDAGGATEREAGAPVHADEARRRSPARPRAQGEPQDRLSRVLPEGTPGGRHGDPAGQGRRGQRGGRAQRRMAGGRVSALCGIPCRSHVNWLRPILWPYDSIMRRSTPPTIRTACLAFHAEKEIDDLADVLLAEISRGVPVHRGSKRPTRWEVEFTLHSSARMLQASFRVGLATILHLDWHARSSADRSGNPIGPGYHVDVYPPLIVDQSNKFWLDPQMASNAHALELLCSAWNIRLAAPTGQGLLL
jgi:hypothetical protein